MNPQIENRAAPIVEGLNAAIRENPLAAGLIGAGIAWILMGGAKGIGIIAGAATGAAAMSGAAAASAGARVGSGISQAAAHAAGGLKEVASGVSDSVSSIVPDVAFSDTVDDVKSGAEQFKSAAGEQWNAVTATGRDYSRVLQSRLSESLEQQPLLLGAIGLVIGAGVASAFGTTSMERDLMGEHGAAARDRLQELADQAKERATNVVSDLKDEAVKQGLTPDAATKAAGDIVGKVKATAGAAGSSFTQDEAPSGIRTP